jgi:hypothetical protein
METTPPATASKLVGAEEVEEVGKRNTPPTQKLQQPMNQNVCKQQWQAASR